MSYYTMFFIGVAPFGHYLAGWLAEHIGPARTFVVGGCLAIVAGTIFAMQLATFREHLRPLYVRRGIIAANPEDP